MLAWFIAVFVVIVPVNLIEQRLFLSSENVNVVDGLIG